MLQLTNSAVDAVKAIVRDTQMPEGAGLRISSGPLHEGRAELEVELTPEPGEQDQVVEQKGAHLFLEPAVAQFLDDKVLDAAARDDGIMFSVTDRSSQDGIVDP